MISKSFVAISAIVLGIVVSTCHADDTWTPDPTCPYPSDVRTYYYNPANCSTYYVCYGGEKNLLECPPDMYWNHLAEYCDDLDHVDCTRESTTPTKPTTLFPPSTINPGSTTDGGDICSGVEDGTFLNHPTDCHKYIECVNGQADIFDCPPGTAWDESVLTCDENVTFPSSSLDDRDPFCPYPSEEITYYPFPGDCHQFIECYEGYKYYKKCPTDLYWNQAVNNCDYECHTSEVPNDGTTTPHGNYDPDCPDSGTFYYPHYSNCEKFYQCRNGYKLVLHCTTGYAYSTVLNTCDLIQNVDCSYTTNAPPTTSPGSHTTADYNNCPSTGTTYLPNFANCSKFYECNDGEKTELSCQDDYAWDISLSTCAEKENVDCSYTTVGPGTTSPTEAPRTTIDYNNCPSTGTTYLPNFANCSKFYECNDGEKTELSCQENYAWDIYLSTCAEKENVDCSYVTGQPPTADTTVSIGWSTTAHTSNTHTTTRTTSAPSDQRCADKPDGTLLAIDDDDSKYIECANGKDVIMSCAPGTTFDEADGVCNT